MTRPDADVIPVSRAARAVGRFNPDGPVGYRAATMPDAPLRATRAEAEADERAHRLSRRSSLPLRPAAPSRSSLADELGTR